MMYTKEQASELYQLALCIWREARGESDEAKLGVAWTIHNRVKLQGWMGKTYSDVVWKPYQFSSFNAGDPNSAKIPNPNSDKSYVACLDAADKAFSGAGDDPTNGATHYYDDSIAAPKWTAGATLTVKLGKLNFYKDVK
jgi:spore germination cell wall hydrolase CwlJ-like protein